MDLLKKVETLLNAAARARLPHRERRSLLDEQEEALLAKIRQALADVEAQERVLYQQLQTEEEQAAEAARRGDRPNQQAHERRAAELERHLEAEGIRAIDLEEKLAALEEKLALAKAAVDKEARAAALREEAADKILSEDSSTSAGREISPEAATDDEADLAARKARLSD